MNYKNKYLKYKMKYLNVIKKTGGSLSRKGRADRRNITKQIEELQNKIIEKDEKIEELQNEIIEKDEEISTFPDLYKDMEEHNKILQQNLDSCNQNLDNCNPNFTHLNNIQQLYTIRIRGLINEVDRLNGEINRLNNLVRMIQNNSQIA